MQTATDEHTDRKPDVQNWKICNATYATTLNNTEGKMQRENG